MNIFKNGLLVVLAIITVNIFAAEDADGYNPSNPLFRLVWFGKAAREGGAAGGILVGADKTIAEKDMIDELGSLTFVSDTVEVPEGYTRIIFSDKRIKDFRNPLFNKLPVLNNLLTDLPDNKDPFSLGFKEGEDLDGRFELAVKISNATKDNFKIIFKELEQKSFSDVLKIAKILDFLNFEDTKSKNIIAQILYRQYKALSAADRAIGRLLLDRTRIFYGMDGKVELPDSPLTVIPSAIVLAFSPDESLLGVKDRDHNFQMYRTKNMKPFEGPISSVIDFKFSPNKSLLGVIDYNKNFQMYNTANMKPFERPILRILGFDFSSDGTLLGMMDCNRNFQMFSTTNMKPFERPILNIFTFSFSSYGSLLGIVDINHNSNLYNTKDMIPLVGKAISNVSYFVFSPDGLLIGIRYKDYSFQLYTKECKYKVGNLIFNIATLSFSSDGSLLGVRDIDHNFQMYRIDKNQLVPVGNRISNVCFFNFSPDGLVLGILKHNKEFQLYGINNVLPIGNVLSNIFDFSFSPDGSVLGINHDNYNLSFYKKRTLMEKLALETARLETERLENLFRYEQSRNNESEL